MKRYRADLECRDDEPVLPQLLPNTIPEEKRENSTLTSDNNDKIGDWQSLAAETREIIIKVPDNIKTAEINVQTAKSLRSFLIHEVYVMPMLFRR